MRSSFKQTRTPVCDSSSSVWLPGGSPCWLLDRRARGSLVWFSDTSYHCRGISTSPIPSISPPELLLTRYFNFFYYFFISKFLRAFINMSLTLFHHASSSPWPIHFGDPSSLHGASRHPSCASFPSLLLLPLALPHCCVNYLLICFVVIKITIVIFMFSDSRYHNVKIRQEEEGYFWSIDGETGV